MLGASGCPVQLGLPNELSLATVVIDAILGTGLKGSAQGEALSAIRTINHKFPLAKKVAVDMPSGLPGDEFVKADHTVTFVAAKRTQVLLGGNVGHLTVVSIGTPEDIYKTNPLNLSEPGEFVSLFAPRPCNSNKGMYGHVLVVGGSFGKSGAPVMTGLGSYRSGAGLVTVAVPESILNSVAGYRPELMTEPTHDPDRLLELARKMTVLAVGPGLGEDKVLAKRLYEEAEIPGVFDADALNAMAGDFPHTDKVRILTPHPGEMSRLAKKPVKEIQANRLEIAQEFARKSGAVVVLKGDRTVIAFPDGETWINPTGSPSMSTGGTGDVLTGMIAGLIAQHPKDWKRATVAAVWLHGRIGELAAQKWGEQAMLATDMLEFLPEAMNEVRHAL